MKAHTVAGHALIASSIIAIGAASGVLRAAVTVPTHCVINAEGQAYDSHPSTAVSEDGVTWIAWHAYREGSDRVLIRRIDAEGEPDELTHYARDRARLDVVVFTENDFLYDVPLTQHEYELGNLLARVYTQEGRFLSLPGFEWTSRVPADPNKRLADPGNWTPPYTKGSHPNHRSVIYPRGAGPVVRHPEVGNDIVELNRVVAKAGGLTLTQHAAFRLSGHKAEVGMELVSGWGNYIGRRPGLFHGALDRGIPLAFVANGDSHRRAPGLSGGLTGIFAETLTDEAILDALRRRRCFATNGSRILVDSRAGGAIMGQVVQAEDHKIALTLRAVGTRRITSAVLIRDGKELNTFKGNGDREIRVSFEDSHLAGGTHWYCWRVAQRGESPGLPGNLSAAHGHLAWSSPHWVVVP